MDEVSTTVAAMVRHARQYLEAAASSLDAGRRTVAFDEARHAAEVAAKALYLKATGDDYGKGHPVASRMAAVGLLPSAVPEKKWSRFYSEHTRASYGYFEEFSELEVRQAIEWADVMIVSCDAYPDCAFHAPHSA